MTSTTASRVQTGAVAGATPAGARPRVREGQAGLCGPAVTRRPGLHLTTRGYGMVLLALVLLLLAAFTVGRSASSRASEQVAEAPVATSRVTVQQGDTLWSIARRVAPGRDPRDVVAQIKRLNHLPGAAVQAGRQLVLPAVV